MKTTYKEGWYLFSAPDDEMAMIQAREYINDNGLTADDVKVVRSEGMISVKTKREVTLGP